MFGTFDLLHDGHRYFLREARKLGGKLIVAVAPDATVVKIKGHLPQHSLGERIVRLREEKLADTVLAGNVKMRSWDVIYEYKPDIIAVGYDQTNLAEALKHFLITGDYKFELKIIGPYLDGSLHSSSMKQIIV